MNSKKTSSSYSNILEYGGNGECNKIIMPTPGCQISAVLFNNLKPHEFNPTYPKVQKTTGYRTLETNNFNKRLPYSNH
jgi:hypothetical protein